MYGPFLCTDAPQPVSRRSLRLFTQSFFPPPHSVSGQKVLCHAQKNVVLPCVVRALFDALPLGRFIRFMPERQAFCWAGSVCCREVAGVAPAVLFAYHSD